MHLESNFRVLFTLLLLYVIRRQFSIAIVLLLELNLSHRLVLRLIIDLGRLEPHGVLGHHGLGKGLLLEDIRAARCIVDLEAASIV